MKNISLEALARLFEHRPDVVFATIFGSAKDGTLADGSDVDIGVCFRSKPDTDSMLELMSAISDVTECDAIDLVDVRSANPIAAFEAISGKYLAKNDHARRKLYR